MDKRIYTIPLTLGILLLLLTACGEQSHSVLPPGGGKEFSLLVGGNSELRSTSISFDGDDGKIHQISADSVLWYYDRPEEYPETADLYVTPIGENRVNLHLHQSHQIPKTGS